MKLKIFSLIAILMLAFSVGVSADSTVIGPSDVGDAYVSEDSEKPADQTLVMAVNPGDRITITVTGAKDNITLISYKGSEPVVEKMQYINQYSTDTTTISYEIREIGNTQNGLYLLMINDGTNVSSFYYKVGRPELDHGEGVNYYTRVDFGQRNDEFAGTTSVAYLAAFSPAGGTVERYGFSVKKDATSEATDIGFDGDIAGPATFEFGITIFNLKPVENNSINDIINNLVVVPYVNYSDTEAVDA